jgi:hypothetical protein
MTYEFFALLRDHLSPTGLLVSNLITSMVIGRVTDFGNFQPLREKSNTSIDLAQPFLAVVVVAVFRPVAITGSPMNYLDHFGAL